MTTRSATELVSFPVIATNEGREIGRVKDVLFDPGEHELLGMMVRMPTPAEPTKFLPRQAIHSIGDHAVTVESEGSLGEVSSFGRVKEVLDSGIHLKGASVLTEDGDAVGKLDKILLDDAGRVAAYEVSRGILAFGQRKRIPPEDIISIGQDAIVVSSAYRDEDDDDEDEDEKVVSSPSQRPAESERADGGGATRLDA